MSVKNRHKTNASICHDDNVEHVCMYFGCYWYKPKISNLHRELLGHSEYVCRPRWKAQYFRVP
jgi:hypothetical protein